MAVEIVDVGPHRREQIVVAANAMPGLRVALRGHHAGLGVVRVLTEEGVALPREAGGTPPRLFRRLCQRQRGRHDIHPVQKLPHVERVRSVEIGHCDEPFPVGGRERVGPPEPVCQSLQPPAGGGDLLVNLKDDREDRLNEEMLLRTDGRHVGEIARERLENEARHGANRRPHPIEVVANRLEARDDGVGRNARRWGLEHDRRYRVCRASMHQLARLRHQRERRRIFSLQRPKLHYRRRVAGRGGNRPIRQRRCLLPRGLLRIAGRDGSQCEKPANHCGRTKILRYRPRQREDQLEPAWRGRHIGRGCFRHGARCRPRPCGEEAQRRPVAGLSRPDRIDPGRGHGESRERRDPQRAKR